MFSILIILLLLNGPWCGDHVSFAFLIRPKFISTTITTPHLWATSKQVLNADSHLMADKFHNDIQKQNLYTSMWDFIRHEATGMCHQDLQATSLLTNAILSQPSFESALIDFVVNQLETPLFQSTQIRNIFADVCNQNASISTVWAHDLLASTARDKSQPNIVSVLLFNRGLHSLVTHRIAHSLWYSGRDGLARFFQSLASRTFASDIHPACSIGAGCYISAGSGVVVGETASLGSQCCIKHGVTLGGTGKESGDRHPKLGNGVFVASGATILGNIQIGDNSIVNAGSVVTKAVAPHTRVGGVPARFISSIPVSAVPDISPSSPLEELALSLGLCGRFGLGSGEGEHSITVKHCVSATDKTISSI